MIKAINYKLKDVSKEKQKRKEILERQKAKALAIKHCKARREISLSNTKKRNYENNTKDDTDLDQTNNKNPLQL